jgi:hypothetical protein
LSQAPESVSGVRATIRRALWLAPDAISPLRVTEVQELGSI